MNLSLKKEVSFLSMNASSLSVFLQDFAKAHFLCEVKILTTPLYLCPCECAGAASSDMWLVYSHHLL